MSCDNKVLKKTNYLSLKEIKCPEKNIEGYIFSHEERCDGHIMAILPFSVHEFDYQYLLRYELTPCWDMDHNLTSSITGGIESDDPKDDAVRELKEEAGYSINKNELIDLGTCRNSKSSDTIIHLYSANLVHHDQGEAEGDGSYLEDQAYCYWSSDVNDSVDPLVYTLYYKLQKYLNQ